MSQKTVKVGGLSIPVERTGSQRLRTVAFQLGDREYQAIEQNPEKPSRWAQLARDGHKVVQFRDVSTNKYVAVSVDGNVKMYGK